MRSRRCTPSSPAATSPPALRRPHRGGGRPGHRHHRHTGGTRSTWSSSTPTRPATRPTSRPSCPSCRPVASSPPTTRCGAAGSSTQSDQSEDTVALRRFNDASGRRPPGRGGADDRARRGHPHPPGRLAELSDRARLSPPPVASLAERRRTPPSNRWLPTAPGRRRPASTEIAVTEHLFRFTQAKDLLGGFWDDLPGRGPPCRYGRVLGSPRPGRPRRLRRGGRGGQGRGAPRRPRPGGRLLPGADGRGGPAAGRLSLRRAPRLGPLAGGVALRRPRRSRR